MVVIMNNDVNVKELMFVLTFINVIILTVILLALSSEPEDEMQEIIMMNTFLMGQSIEEKEEPEAIMGEQIAGETQIIMKEDYNGDVNDSYIELLGERLRGVYYITDFMWFDFEPNGVYSGFFENDGLTIANGFYEIVIIEDVPILHIYNQDMTKMIPYTLILDKNYIILQNGAVNIELKNRD